jgi:hypothetical protein
VRFGLVDCHGIAEHVRKEVTSLTAQMLS